MVLSSWSITIKRVPIACVEGDTCYLSGTVEALCLQDSIYDVIIGNVPGSSPHQSDSDIHSAVMVTRAQEKSKETITHLKVPEASLLLKVDKERLKELQNQDCTLERYRPMTETIYMMEGQSGLRYEIKNGILYRLYIHPRVNGGQPVRQVVVPKLCRQVKELAHQSILGGHMGSRRTIDPVLSNFCWPSVRREVTPFCKSCYICQRTDKRGVCGRVPLQNVSIIDVPFKRVVVDLVGPISPPSDGGHRYILTVVDYVTRYPEAIPLKNINTKTVAEAPLDIYSRVRIPEEVLSDLGRQPVSDCMKEVSRLLSIS